MPEKFWDEFKELDDKFGKRKIRLCKKHGFITTLEGWNYCPTAEGKCASKKFWVIWWRKN